MRRRIMMLGMALVVAGHGCGRSAGSPPPLEGDVKPALESYLIAEHQKRCTGKVSLDHLSVTRVGDYDQVMGGYPVFAGFSTTCQSGGNRETFNGEGSSNAAAAYVRKSISGAWEAYMPDIFRQGQAQASKQVEEMMKKMQPH